MLRPKVRRTEPVIASSTRTSTAARCRRPAGRRPARSPAPGRPPRRSPRRPRACAGRSAEQPGHALQVVLDPVVHLLDQHVALRDRRLEARLLGGALLGDVGRDQQQLVRRLAARRGERQLAGVPDLQLAVALDPVLAGRHLLRAQGASMSRRRSAPTAAPNTSSGVRPISRSGVSPTTGPPTRSPAPGSASRRRAGRSPAAPRRSPGAATPAPSTPRPPPRAAARCRARRR